MSMKKTLFLTTVIVLSAIGLTGCKDKTHPLTNNDNFSYNVDKFYDLEVLRYRVEGFEQLSLQQKQLIYYLSEAALQGRDILYDQNCRYNLRIRRAVEAVYLHKTNNGEMTLASAQDEQDQLLEKYLKRVWFSNGIHHHYSEDKFLPEFSREWFEAALAEAGYTLD